MHTLLTAALLPGLRRNDKRIYQALYNFEPSLSHYNFSFSLLKPIQLHWKDSGTQRTKWIWTQDTTSIRMAKNTQHKIIMQSKNADLHIFIKKFKLSLHLREKLNQER